MILSGKGRELKLESIGKNINVSVSASFERKELGGQSSSTAFASAGSKPKKVNVGMMIPTDKSDGLTKLMEMAEANDDKGSPLVYTVADALCGAAMIRQVVFAGSINAKKNDSLLAYEVSFSLQEFKSVAEKREERDLEKSAKDAPANPEAEKVASADPEKVNDAIKKVRETPEE